MITALDIEATIVTEAAAIVDAEFTRQVMAELARLERRYVRGSNVIRDERKSSRRYEDEVTRYKVLPYSVQAHLAALSRDERLPLKVRAEARTMLVMSNQRIVIQLVKQFLGRGVGYEPLVQAGNEGMLEAVEQFRDGKGANFVTYAKQKITMRMGRLCENNSAAVHGVRLPVDFYNFVYTGVRNAIRVIEASGHDATAETIQAVIAADITAENERKDGTRQIPTVEQVADACGWLTGRRPISFQSKVSDEDGAAEFGTILEGTASVEAEAFNNSKAEAIDAAFAELDERQRKCFGSSVGYDRYPFLGSATKIAEHYGIKVSEARKAITEAREIVQAHLSGAGHGA